MCGMTPVIGVVLGGVDALRRKRLGRRLFAVIKFTQQTQHIELPRQLRALQSDVPERTLELLSYGGTALSDHDGESRQVPVLGSANCRRLVERTAK